MGLAKFQSSGTPPSKELQDLRLRTGAAHGELSLGTQVVKGVLRLGPNVYATTEKVPQTIKSALNLVKADIHEIKTPGEASYFLQRWRAFSREEQKNGKAS